MPTSHYLFALAGLGLASSCQPASPPAAGLPPPRPAASGPGKSDCDTLADARLVAIRQLVASLNAQPHQAWSAVRRVAVADAEDTGNAVFYYQHHDLRKITVWYYAETGQQRVDYYLLAGQLAYVQERTSHYSQPITYVPAPTSQGTTPEITNAEKPLLLTSRSYFDHGQLLCQPGSPAGDPAAGPAYRRLVQRQRAAELRRLRAQAAALAKQGL